MTTRFAAVTVHGVDAPHTTPVAAVHHAGRWWFTTSRHAAKTAMLRRDPVASVTVARGPGWATSTGDVTVVDPTDPGGLARRASTTLAAPPAALRLLAAHAGDVVGYLADAADVPSAWAPHQRVLVAVDETIVERSVEPERRDHDAVRCIAGFSDGRRTIAVPGWFDGRRLRIGPTSRPIDPTRGTAIMLDRALLDDDAGRPGAQRGVLVRGRLTDDDGSGGFDVVAAAITTWDGFDTSTRRFPTDTANAA